MKTALITGVSRQGGPYLARKLLSEGYHVVGTSRAIAERESQNLVELKIKDSVSMRAFGRRTGRQPDKQTDQTF